MNKRQDYKIPLFSTYLKEIVYGGNDGIITTFAVVAGFSGAQLDSLPASIVAVLLFGFANLFADASSMGLGNFLSVRAEQDVYKTERAKERELLDKHPHEERAETMDMLTKEGFSEEDAKTLTSVYANNKKYWTEFMMRYEYDLPNPLAQHAGLMGLITFCSFVFFGFIPLLPYVILGPSDSTFVTSIFFTLLALLLLGTLRYKVTSRSMIRSIGETLFLGGISAAIAYFVGTLFRA